MSTQNQDSDLILPGEITLSPEEQRKRSRKRRRRELFFAGLAFVFVLVLTSVQLGQLRAGEAIFMVMFQVNFVLLAGVLLVVLRNGFKLLLERRRRIMGSRLRTRMVLSFVGFSLLPCLLMFFVTAKYVQLSMDFWFKEQVETSMETALDLAGTIYDKAGSVLVNHARGIEAEVAERGYTWGGQSMDALLERKRQEYGLALVGLYYHDGSRKNWHAVSDSNSAWEAALKDFNWELLRNQGSAYAYGSGEERDYIFALLAVEHGERGAMALAFDMGEGFKARLDRIAQGSREYRNLRNLKRPLKLLLYSSLGVLTAMIILGAAWFGFRIAREFASPILALAAGTRRIAEGDLSVRILDKAQDEFGMLIRSFNRMAQDLEASRGETTSAYTMLAEQNRETERHSKYIETVLNNIAAGVASFDEHGYITTVNQAACDILSMDEELLLGKRIEDFLPGKVGLIASAMQKRFSSRQEKRARYSVSLTIAGEERRLLINVVGFSSGGAYRGAVAVFEDITELERMQRMAAWREVARRIAHEIKNPLTPIKLSAQRLARKFGHKVDDPAFTQSTDLIVRQVEHLQDMVQEFSAFAKLPEVKPQPGKLEPLLQSMLELFRNSHSGIRWELDIPEALPVLPMDREALQRAFMNILTNAADALNNAGTKKPTVLIRAAHHPELRLVRIDVEDNGPGLSDEERSRLFEPYFSRKRGGTGLGLTIVRSIVSDHRGYVRATVSEQGGTVLSMELPLA
ncbi:HAMP domain-containing protein [Desulfovibrio sp. OttesenSCG-928-A18]|nr:HAMP domain-containing protein [Desulfovibrio sp. OttesenSCG-928-A18]